MLKTLTLVRRKPGLSRSDFFEAWKTHTQDWDLKDHPEISRNLLRMIELPGGEEAPFDGVAENHWPDLESLQKAAAWYETDAGREHLADLMSFMDVANSPTTVVTDEADIS